MVVVAGQPGFGRAPSRWIARVITSLQGHRAVKRSQRQRPVVTSWRRRRTAAGEAFGLPAAGFCNQGEHRHPGEEVECDLDDLQPDPVLGVSCRGRLRSPVARAFRMRSSQRARLRWRSSRSASWPPFGVGREAGQPQSVEVGEAQLGRPGAGVPCETISRIPQARCSGPGMSVISATRRRAARWPPGRRSRHALFDLQDGLVRESVMVIPTERPHPGAQLRFTDLDGLRLTCFATKHQKAANSPTSN